MPRGHKKGVDPQAAHSIQKQAYVKRHADSRRESYQKKKVTECMIAADAVPAGPPRRAGGEAEPSGTSFESDVIERRVRKGCIDEVLLFAMLCQCYLLCWTAISGPLLAICC